MTDRDRRAAEANARARNARIAIPPRDEVNRYDRLSPDARTLLEQFDELDLAEMLAAVQAAIARVRALHRKATHGQDCVHCAAFGPAYDNTWPCQTIRVLDGTAPVPPTPEATEATELDRTARVFAALHQSAEQDVSRVIALYEQWVKAGPPPLGTPISRWWDKRLVELHDAILPPTDQPKEG